jgi:hypothetical protein
VERRVIGERRVLGRQAHQRREPESLPWPRAVRRRLASALRSSAPGLRRHPASHRWPHAGRTRPPGSGALVAFARSDLNVRWDPGYASLLEFAEACDVPVRW